MHETIRVKSAAWDDTGVLVYTTLNHIKYCLPNGDSGIIRTLEVPVYITRVSGSSLHCLDRDGKTRQIQVGLLLRSCSLSTDACLVTAASIFLSSGRFQRAQVQTQLALEEALLFALICAVSIHAFSKI